MRIEDILKEIHPEVYQQLCKNCCRINCKNKKDTLSFKDYEMLMKHSSYKRHRGALRQVR